MPEMIQEQAPQGQPQEQQAPGGAEVMKKLAETAIRQSEALKQMGQAVAELGAQGPAEKLMQASQMIEAAMSELGAGAGGAQPADGASPDTAGVAGAVPADARI